MESNGSDTNHVDADVRLPPRKRLLAGLKRQSLSESTSQCSQENNPSPSLSLSIVQSPLSEFDIRLNNLLKTYKNGSKMSPEEIALAAKSAAEVAAKAAEKAKAIAEEKAAIAAKAVAAARSALNLVAVEETSSRAKHHKKNKSKNHVSQPIENQGDDEEVARRLHRVMNSSPRISKHSPGSSSRNHKHKKLKMSLPNDTSGVSNGTSVKDGDVNFPNGDAEGEMGCKGSNEVEVDSGEAKSSQQKEKTFEGFDDLSINGRKRGRTKQKTLPLSICSSKDEASPKEELKLANSLLETEKSAAHHLSLLSVEPSTDNASPMEVTPTWKCQDFKVSQCIKQDKLVES